MSNEPESDATSAGANHTLKRALSLPLLTLYGIGTIVGGGIYALVGEVAAEAGTYAPAAFLMAALIALFSANSYASLATRYPVSASEAEYVRAAFGREQLSALVGWLVISTALVSTATLSRAIVGFIGDFVSIPIVVATALTVGVLAGIAAWGIAESVWMSVAITVIEVGGLVLVIVLERDALGELPTRWEELMPGMQVGAWRGIGLGAFLAFYAFVGFEDMVNVSEEVHDPTRIMPMAIALALGTTTLLYLSVTTIAVLAVPIDELAKSGTPVARIIANHGTTMTRTMGLISLLAGVNGALIQIIMATRVAYGMATRGGAPAWLGYVNPRTRTPVRATAATALIVFTLALWLPLDTLARVTSAITLVVFGTVNMALIVIRLREVRSADDDMPLRTRDVIPVVGVITCAAFLVFQITTIC